MRVTALSVLITIVLFAYGAQAQAQLPMAVQQEVLEMFKTCRDEGGVPVSSSEWFIVAELTGDDVPDYVINQGAFNCSGGSASYYCGSGGCSAVIYVGTSNGQAFKALDSMFFNELKVDKSVIPSIVQVAVGGLNCGQRNTEKIARADLQACWRPIEWNYKKRKMEFAPISQVKIIH